MFRKRYFLLRNCCVTYIPLYEGLAERPQCYCGEIRQMLTFLINFYCPKAYHRPDHSISFVEYHKKLFLNPPSPRLEPRTVFGFVTLVSVISSSKQTTLVLAPFFYRAWFPNYRNRPHRNSNSGHFSGSFDFPMFSSRPQRVSMRSLVQIGSSLIEL
jgi:hypothetical protein